MMKWTFNSDYPSVDDLRKKAISRIPKFAFEYLDGGCNEDVNLIKNTEELRQTELTPYYLKNHTGSSLQTELLDGIIVSNHGGRQLDAGQSSVASLHTIIKRYENKIKIMMDSGIRSGPDVARAMASGAEFTFLARSFMYAVAALGNKGGDHAIAILKTQLQQVMEQLCCEKTKDLHKHLV